MTQLLRALTNNLQVRVTHAIQNCLDKFFHLINVLSRPFYASTTQILEKCWKNNLKPEIAFEEQTVYNVTYIIKTSVCVEMSRPSTWPILEKILEKMFSPEIALEEQSVYKFIYIIKTIVCVEMSRPFPVLIKICPKSLLFPCIVKTVSFIHKTNFGKTNLE